MLPTFGKWNERNKFTLSSPGKESNKPALMHVLHVKYICYFLILQVTYSYTKAPSNHKFFIKQALHYIIHEKITFNYVVNASHVP